MQRRDYFDRMRRPTMEQFRYVEELIQAPRRGTAAKIAKDHGVSPALVSRFFRDCRASGYLTEDGELTEDGRIWYNYYKEIEEGLTRYLERMGVAEASIPEHVGIMEELMEDQVLAAILETSEQAYSSKSAVKASDEECYTYLKNRMEKGRYRVDFILLKSASERKWEQTLSMADRGFLKPAELVFEEDQAFLELTPCEMKAESRISGDLLSGHLSSLSYVVDGILKKAEFVNGAVRIPLEACVYHMLTEGRLNCCIPVTVTCSVGLVHMPESTAWLVFWL